MNPNPDAESSTHVWERWSWLQSSIVSRATIGLLLCLLVPLILFIRLVLP